MAIVLKVFSILESREYSIVRVTSGHLICLAMLVSPQNWHKKEAILGIISELRSPKPNKLAQYPHLKNANGHCKAIDH